MKIEDLAATRERFVPYLHEAGYEDAVKDMGFAEAVAVLAGAIEYMESGKPTEAGFGDEYAAAVRAARTEVAYKALTARKLWYVRDKATRSPLYDSLGMLWIFSNKRCADLAIQRAAKEREGLDLVSVDGSAREFLERAVRYQGASGFVIDNGYAPVFLRADEVASRVPAMGAPLSHINVANPDLVAALTRSVQLGNDGLNRPAAIHMMDAVKELRRATFIVPAMETKDKLVLPSIMLGGLSLTPVYTDITEFRMGVPGPMWTDGTCLNVEECLNLCRDGILLNPGSLAWACPADQLRIALRNSARAERAHGNTAGTDSGSAQSLKKGGK